LAVSRQLLSLIVQTFVPAGCTVDLVIDETLERRWGAQISKRGHYRDSALSSRKQEVKQSRTALDRDGCCHYLALDHTAMGLAIFLCAGNDPPPVSKKLGKRHKTVGMWAHQMVSVVRRWLPDIPIKLMGDTAYSILELGLHCASQRITLIAPFRAGFGDSHLASEANLIHKCRVPVWLASDCHPSSTSCMIRATVWQCITLDWYGEGKRDVEICTATALWYRYGLTPLPVRWVLTRDPAGKRPPKALFSTDQAQTAEQIIVDAHEALESGEHL
jgi:hypothetical protein